MPESYVEISPQNLLTKLKNSFARGGFVNHVTTMLAGNISAQVISFVATPFITRLYSPDDFGSMTLVWSYVGIFSVIACLRYEEPIVIEKKNNNAYNILLLCIIILSSFSLILAGCIFFFGKNIVEIIGLKESEKLLWFIPCGVFVFGINKTLTYWFVRSEDFLMLSFCRINLSLITVGTKLTLGLLFFSSGFWLLAGNVMGLIGSVVILAGLFLRRSFLQFKPYSTWENIVASAKKYSKFPRYHSFTGILNSLSQNLPILLFAHYFSPQIVGYYGLADTILRKPISLVAQSLSTVFLQKAAVSHAQGNSLRNDWFRTTIGLLIVGVLPFGILLVWGSSLFSIVFGEDWGKAGLYAQLLSPWLFMGFINPPSTQILIVLQKLEFNLYFNMINILLKLIAIFFVSNITEKPEVVIGVFSALGVFLNVYYMFYAFKQIRLNKE